MKTNVRTSLIQTSNNKLYLKISAAGGLTSTEEGERHECVKR